MYGGLQYTSISTPYPLYHFVAYFTTYIYYHIFNMHILCIVIDSNQDEEDQEEMEPEEGNGMHLSS